MSEALDDLESRLGHTFGRRALLIQALTHSSATPRRESSNERLEFLGDRVLGLVLARMLFDTFGDEKEGELGYRFTALAQRASLARVAGTLGLAPLLILSEGEEETGGRANPGLLADAMEAVIAAVYLDGGLAPAEDLVRRHWMPLMAENLRPPKDAKTMLQEWAQARSLPLPVYTVEGRSGPDHAPIFTVTAAIEGRAPVTGEGNSKRAAEQAAAALLLESIEAAT